VRELLIMALIVAVAGSAGAATYYVDDVNGLDDPTRNGGPGDPWRTITYALSRVTGENTFMCRGTFEEEVWVGYEDRRSVFTANPEASLIGCIECEYETNVDLNGFYVYGYAAGGSVSGIEARNCYFNYPSGTAFRPARYNGAGSAYDCVFEDCKKVMAVGGFEFGRARFSGCTVKNCGDGIWYAGEATVSAYSCRFENVTGTAFGASIWGEFATVSDCVLSNCGTGVSMAGTWHGGSGTIKDSTFKYNNIAITATHSVEDWGGITITNNVVTENGGPGVALGGVRIKLRGNVITDNDGHGVYITEGAPDLGIPGDPGGNTFAGNGSGYDVYNASSEDIPAYGNTWDAQSEQEMEGKTWQEVNVTRIYDHWDDPSVGYVKWSDLSAVRPASLGRIKASFRGEPPSGLLTPSPSSAVR
jgi:parallel beta-helix repeat protein